VVPIVTFQMLDRIVALVHSRLDYGNAVLVGISAYLVRQLQSVLNSSTTCDRTTAPSMRWRHCTGLRVPERVQYKITVLTFKAHRDTWHFLSPSLTYLVGELCRQQVPAA